MTYYKAGALIGFIATYPNDLVIKTPSNRKKKWNKNRMVELVNYAW